MKTVYYKVFFTLLISICNTQKGMESTSLTSSVKKLTKAISSLCNKHKNTKPSPALSTFASFNVNTIFNLPIEQTLVPQKKVFPKKLCFNRNYFYNTILKKYNDGYHGIPANLIANILENGQKITNFFERSSTIHFTAAAIKTNIRKYEYRIPMIITDSSNTIFHAGMHTPFNASKKIDPMIVTAYIKRIQKIVSNSIPKQNNSLPRRNTFDYQLPWKKSTYNVQITAGRLNKIYCCSKATQYTKETVSYSLPNGNLLIVMDPLNA